MFLSLYTLIICSIVIIVFSLKTIIHVLNMNWPLAYYSNKLELETCSSVFFSVYGTSNKKNPFSSFLTCPRV